MNTKELPAQDRREDRSMRQVKLGQPSKTIEPARRQRASRPDRKSGLKRQEQSPASLNILREADFFLEAPSATNVFLAGTFNDWNPHLTRMDSGPDGSWSACLQLAPGEYEYRFVVDGEWWDDRSATRFVDNPYGSKNAVIQVQ